MKVSKYGIFLVRILSPNTGKYRPEKTLYLDTFHAVRKSNLFKITKNIQNDVIGEVYLLYIATLLLLKIMPFQRKDGQP